MWWWILTRLTIIITSQYVLWCTQSCPTLWDPMDCSPPGFSVHGDSPGNNTGVGCCVLLQGIFPTQGSNPGLPHCRWILYHLSHQGSPLGFQYSYTGVSSLSFLQGNFPTQESNQGLLHCRWIQCQLSYQGMPIKSLYYTSETNITLCQLFLNIFSIYFLNNCFSIHDTVNGEPKDSSKQTNSQVVKRKWFSFTSVCGHHYTITLAIEKRSLKTSDSGFEIKAWVWAPTLVPSLTVTLAKE